MLKHRLDDSLHVVRIDRLADLEHDGLVVMVGVRTILIEEPALNGSERQRSDHQPLFRLRRIRSAGDGCEVGNRGVLEDLPRRHAKPGVIAPGNNLDAEDRVASQSKKVVVHAHFFNAQHLRPDFGQGFLDMGAGRDKLLQFQAGLVRFGKRPAVEFSIGCQWQCVDHHERSRHHVVRKLLAGIVTQL